MKKCESATIILFFSIINIFINVLQAKNLRNIINSNYGNITLKISKAGKKIYIYRDNSLDNCAELASVYSPSYVYINGVQQSQVRAYYDFNQTNNIVKLFYNYNIKKTKCLFMSCSNITGIDLSNFNFVNVDDMYAMFQGCISLTSINLKNFYPKNIKNAADCLYAFYNCRSLEYINLENSYILPIPQFTLFGYLDSDKVIICGLDGNHQLKNTFNTSVSVFCRNVTYSSSNCIQKGTNDNTNMNWCKKYCGIDYTEKSIFPDSTSNIYCEYREPEESTQLVVESSTKQTTEYSNKVSESIISEYIDNTCQYYHYIEDNTNIRFCTQNFSCPKDYRILVEDLKECVNDCSKVPLYKYELRQRCYKDCPKNTYKTKRNKCFEFNFDNPNKTNLFQNIKNITFNELDISDVNKGIDLEIDTNYFLISLTNNFNQMKNFKENKNKTIINLQQCEERLKSVNNIPQDISLYILKLDLEEKGMKIPKVEYEVFYLNNNSKFIQLNLKECENTNIDIYLPVDLDDGTEIGQYNSSSDYYNNICSKTTSNKGTDISLTDRKNNFIENNLTLCEEDCILEEYNTTSKKAKCNCLIKIKLPLIEHIKFDKKKLYKSFTDINNIANIQFMKCAKDVFKGKNLKKNIGFFIFILFICFHLVSSFLFYFKYYSELINEVRLIVDAKIKISNQNEKENKRKNKRNKKNRNKKAKNKEEEKGNKKILLIPPKKTKIGRNKKEKKVDFNVNKNNNNNSGNKEMNQTFSDLKKELKANIDLRSTDSKKSKKDKILDTSFTRKKIKEIKLENDNEQASSTPKNKTHKILELNNDKNNKNNIKEKNDSIINKYEKALTLKDNELNTLSYEEALKQDKRTFIEYYISLLKKNHLILFSFYYKNKDYNSQIIKVFLFFFHFSVHLTVNAFFFSDETMHKIYIDEGKFNFLYQISQIIYSSLISAVINILVKFLSLTEKSIIELKGEKEVKNLENRFNELISQLKIKFAIFFGITFILLLSFAYYISCFCGIYINTQVQLITDSVISFGMSFLYPFAKYVLPTVFRIPSLRAKKKDKSCMYKFSQLIQNI